MMMPGSETSYWLETMPPGRFPKLERSLRADAVIVGGGICGLSTAYLLKKSGLKVAVVEKDTIGAGTSGHTTGKITSQHGLAYGELMQRLGKKAARDYGQANQAALEEIRKIVVAENINCDWQYEDNYVFTAQKEQVGAFRREAAAAAEAGLPASFETSTPLPFNVAGAVRFSRQAAFHAGKYMAGLARGVNGGGSYVFERTRAIGIRDGGPGKVRTAGGMITAGHIIVATNVPTFPLIARGAYCAAEYPQKSYVIASRVPTKLRGMYISPDRMHYSILPVTSGKDRLLLIGGESHVPGTRFNSETRYQRLADYARQHFGVEQIDYRWSARDYLAYDDVPLVGQVYPWSQHLYTATAFRKWGLTNTMAAAMILSDRIRGKESPWAETFDTMRLSPIMSIPKVIKEKLVG